MVIVFGVSVHGAYALARAPFPDSSKLQPIPEMAHPDISRNVERSNSIIPTAEYSTQGGLVQSSGDMAETSSTAVKFLTETPGKRPMYMLLVVFAGIALFLFGFIAWLMRAV